MSGSATEETVDSQTVKCSNCTTVSEVEIVDGIPDEEVEEQIRVENCPDCGLPHLSAVQRTSCMDCDSEVFNLIQEEPPRSGSGPRPTIKCVDCGREADVDEDGAWW